MKFLVDGKPTIKPVCVCVCVCVYMHTHKHAYAHFPFPGVSHTQGNLARPPIQPQPGSVTCLLGATSIAHLVFSTGRANAQTAAQGPCIANPRWRFLSESRHCH